MGAISCPKCPTRASLGQIHTHIRLPVAPEASSEGICSLSMSYYPSSPAYQQVLDGN